MNKTVIAAVLKQYKKNRGWGRFFFGDTKGMNELKAFYKTINHTNELHITELTRLYTVLKTRQQRLQGRKDDYPTAIGQKKLTNRIYKALESQLSAAIDADPYLQDLVPKEAVAAPSSFNQLAIFPSRTLNQPIVFNLLRYCQNVTSTGLSHPVDKDQILPEASRASLRAHGYFGYLFSWIERIFAKFSLSSLSTPIKLSDWIISDQGILEFRSWLQQCDKTSFLLYENSISEIVNQHGELYDPILVSEFTRLKAIAHHNEIANHDNKPLSQRMILNNELFDTIMFLDEFALNTEPKHPLTKTPLTNEELESIAKFLSQQKHIYHQHKIKFIASLQDSDVYLLQSDIERLPKEQQFITDDHDFLNSQLLLHTFTTTTGFLNPLTQNPLSPAELNRLRSDPLVGATFQRLENTYERYQSLTSHNWQLKAETESVSLIHLFISKKNQIIPYYKEPHLMKLLFEDYLNLKVERAELIELINLAYDQSEQDISIKQKLTHEQEKKLTNSPIFRNLTQAIQFKSTFSLEEIDKQTFWRLVEHELNLIMRKNSFYGATFLKATRSMLAALKAFDYNPSLYIQIARNSKTIMFDNPQQDFHEYVVRTPESVGQKKGQQALINIVNTFKGAFLTVLRHDLCKPLFDKMDNAGICIGEKTRNIAGWTVNLHRSSQGAVEKSVHDLFADYQAEITASPESKSRFFSGQSAVNFILTRHRDERFKYTNSDGQEREGRVNEDIIIYYLKNYMGHENLPDRPEPDCLKVANNYAALFH